MKKTNEYDNFDRTMRELLKVPHAEIKAKLEAEKAGKKKRKAQKHDNANTDVHKSR